jgi:uncharacterized protein
MRDSKKCRGCGGCCKTVGVEIETPETLADFEYVKWYIFHKGLSVYIDRDGTWNLEIQTKCNHLNKDHRCDIYNERPPVCREFEASQCDVDEDEEDDDSMREFTKPEQIDDYVEELKEKGDFNSK